MQICSKFQKKKNPMHFCCQLSFYGVERNSDVSQPALWGVEHSVMNSQRYMYQQIFCCLNAAMLCLLQ